MNTLKITLKKHLSTSQIAFLKKAYISTVKTYHAAKCNALTAYHAAKSKSPTPYHVVNRDEITADSKASRRAAKIDNYQITSEGSVRGLLWPWNLEMEHLPATMASGAPWPRISIVTVSYNQGRYLEETIRSVLQQGYPNLQYIVVDGDSTDNTSKILERYRNELDICISEPDRGQSDALNKGFKHADGDILAWINSDDMYLPGTFVKVAEAFSNYSTDIVAGDLLLTEDFNRFSNGAHGNHFPFGKVCRLEHEPIADFNGNWQKGLYFYQPEVFWTRDLWERSGARVDDSLRYAMDYELWLRFAKNGANIVHIPDKLTIFRIHDAQKTKWGNGTQYPEHEAVARRYSDQTHKEHDLQASAQATDNDFDSEETNIASTIPKSVFDLRPIESHKTKIGTFSVPKDALQDPYARAIRAGTIFNASILDVIKECIQPGTICLDIGAGFGSLSVFLSKQTGPCGQVLAFEADDYVHDVLQHNITINQYENIRALKALVAEQDNDMYDFPAAQGTRFPSYSDYRVSEGNVPGTIRSISIDDLGIDTQVSIMLVDVNGMELKVLEGAVETISKYNPVIVVTNNETYWKAQDTSPEELSEFVKGLGYDVTVSRDNRYILFQPVREQMIEHGNQSVNITKALPYIAISPEYTDVPLCKLLKSRKEVEECTDFLKKNGFVSHNLKCKDWDIAHLISAIGEGNFLDMGSSDSYILKNLCIRRTAGEKYGVDLQEPDVPLSDVNYSIGDLMNTGLPGEHFDAVTCLSVLEHQVDYDRFAAEASRLLRNGGRLFITFDYWEPKIKTPVKLYNLDWQPLDRTLVEQLIKACSDKGLQIDAPFDYSLGKPVIKWGYYAPHPDVSYTFAMASFTKKA